MGGIACVQTVQLLYLLFLVFVQTIFIYIIWKLKKNTKIEFHDVRAEVNFMEESNFANEVLCFEKKENFLSELGKTQVARTVLHAF